MIPLRSVLIRLAFIIFCWPQNTAMAQGAEIGLADAIALSQNGQYEAAEQIFQAIEAIGDIQGNAFFIARGYNFSWWGKYEEAKTNFNVILKTDPGYIDAIIGLAFTSTWAGEYPAAVHIYNRALAIDPHNRSAYFGLTHNYLESDNIEGARYVCNQILRIFPTDAEALFIDGLISIKELDPERARESFKAALALDPNSTAAKEQLGKLVKSDGKWQIEGWYGINSNNARTESGVRRVHLQYQLNNRNLIYILYDNSLILDNSFLATTERVAPLVAAGAKFGWNSKLFTKLEFGHRYFTNLPNQTLVNLETNYFFSARIIAKLILQYDDRQLERLGLLGIALDLGFSKHLSLEATFYHNENFIASDIFNRRYQVSGKLLIENFELVVGAYYDQLNIMDTRQEKLTGAFAISTFPIYKGLKGKLFFNHDQGFFENKNTVGAIGLNYNF